MLVSLDATTRSNMYPTEVVEGISEKDISQNAFSDFTTNEFFYYYPTKFNKHRPDLISRETLGDEKYWWCILQFNDIENPFDVYEGQELKIPIFNREIDMHIKGK